MLKIAIGGSLQFQYSYSGTTELHMFIVKVLDEWQGAKVLAHEGAENTISGTVQNAQIMHVANHSIVNKIAHGLYCLLATHTAYVDIGFKLKAFAMKLFLCLAGKERDLPHLLFRTLARLQPVDGNG